MWTAQTAPPRWESAVKKLDGGVTDAAISFMSQRLILEADEDRFDSVPERSHPDMQAGGA